MGEIIKPMTMLMYVGNFFLLFFVAWRFLYRPVTRFIDARAEKLRAERDELDKGRDEIALAKHHQQEEYDAAIAKGEVEVNERLTQADEDAQGILLAARTEADRIIAAANTAAEEETAKAREALREEIASLSVQLSSRILEREVKEEDHVMLIDEFLEKVG